MASSIKPRFAYVGSYTSEERNAKGKGISVYVIDPVTGEWSLVQVLAALNSTFLVLDKTGRFLYSCQGDGTTVNAYSIDDATGRLTALNSQETHGKNGVHILTDPSNAFIVVVSARAVDAYPINEDGSLGPCCSTLEPKGGFGPLKDQTYYLPHQGVFDPSGKFLLIPDKNLDGVHICRFNRQTGAITYNDPPLARARPGAGQRHLDWHPDKPIAYVMDENDNAVTVFSWNSEEGVLTPMQWLPAVPSTFFHPVKGGRDWGSAEIWVAPSGRFVYGSNRGHDSIVIYAADAATGLLSLVDWVPTQGRTPRFFCLSADGTRLFAANLNSHTIVEFAVDGSSGTLSPTGQVVAVESPSCILFR